VDPKTIYDRGNCEIDDMAQKGVRYNPDKMVHPSDGESWTHFDEIHHEKAEEARNVRVVLATDEFNPHGMMATSYSCWPVFVIPLNLPPRRVV